GCSGRSGREIVSPVAREATASPDGTRTAATRMETQRHNETRRRRIWRFVAACLLAALIVLAWAVGGAIATAGNISTVAGNGGGTASGDGGPATAAGVPGPAAAAFHG